ncbi:MAG: Ig-like domain-containing protein [Thermoplasmata archaeon]|nr:Ig-like domain-containing protein [Thermoplasmata archaeon]
MSLMMRKGLGFLIVATLLCGTMVLAFPHEYVDADVPADVLTASHAPIRIDSDTDFLGNATAGNGTIWSPWVIENWEINGTGYGYCICVGNTTQDFIIRNCTLFNTTEVVSLPVIVLDRVSLILYNVTNATIINNTANDSCFGVALISSNNVTMKFNNLTSNDDNGLFLEDSFDNKFIANNISDNNIGLNISSSTENVFYHNNFVNNADNVLDLTDNNWWHNGYPSGGNYWDDYVGIDLFSTPSQDVPPPDGIGDGPYYITVVSQDNYPLMNPYIGQTFGEPIPPFALNYGPNGTDVPTDSNIMIIWNETMNWTSVEDAFNYTDGTNVYNSSNGTWLHNFKTSVFTPESQFDNDTQYWVLVNVTATDASNNPLDQNQSGVGGEWPGDVLSWSFTTLVPDVIPPFALNYTPNGTAVAIGTNIVIEWNESMNWTSVEDAFNYTDGVRVFGSGNGTWAHDPGTNMSTFMPFFPFAYETQYWVAVNCTAADLAGNLLDQDMNGTGGQWPSDVLIWDFTTDDAFPTVMSTIPADGDVDVDPETPIIMIFSEPMNISSVETSFTYSNGTQNFTIQNGSVSWNVEHTRMTFAPAVALDRNTTHTCHLNGSMACDVGGKLLDGNGNGAGGDNYSWTFITWLEPPLGLVLTTFPPNGAVNIAIDTYVNIGFNVEMDTGSVETAFSYTDGINVWFVSGGTVNWFSGNSIFSFVPSLPLAHDTTYSVTIHANALTANGQPLDGDEDGIADGSPEDDFTFSFTTAVEPPIVASTYPADGQTEVPVSLETIYINFSKEMDIPSIVNALSISPNVAYSRSWTSAGRNLTLDLNEELIRGVQYSVGISSIARDVAGNALDGNEDGVGGDNFVLRFVTEGVPDTDPPMIIDIFPKNNATVPTNAYVDIRFSEAMNRTSVENAFLMSNATSEINGTFSWTYGSNRMRFTPTKPLAYNMTYTVLITTAAADESGNRLEESLSWRFFTESKESDGLFEESWWLIAIIFALLMLVAVLYLKNKSLTMDLRRSRVENKRLRRGKSKAQVEEAAPPADVALDKETSSESELGTEEPVDSSSESEENTEEVTPHESERDVPRQ